MTDVDNLYVDPREVLRVYPNGGQIAIKNTAAVGGGTIYYGPTDGVSSTVNTGTIAPGGATVNVTTRTSLKASVRTPVTLTTIGNLVAASALGTLIGKREVYDARGILLGYAPIYDAIT